MTDYRTLPDDVKEELVFDALKFTKACFALSKLTQDSAEVWGERVSNAVYQEMQDISKAEINAAIETIELARQGQYGAGMQRVEVNRPKNRSENETDSKIP